MLLLYKFILHLNITKHNQWLWLHLFNMKGQQSSISLLIPKHVAHHRIRLIDINFHQTTMFGYKNWCLQVDQMNAYNQSYLSLITVVNLTTIKSLSSNRCHWQMLPVPVWYHHWPLSWIIAKCLWPALLIQVTGKTAFIFCKQSWDFFSLCCLLKKRIHIFNRQEYFYHWK